MGTFSGRPDSITHRNTDCWDCPSGELLWLVQVIKNKNRLHRGRLVHLLELSPLFLEKPLCYWRHVNNYARTHTHTHTHTHIHTHARTRTYTNSCNFKLATAWQPSIWAISQRNPRTTVDQSNGDNPSVDMATGYEQNPSGVTFSDVRQGKPYRDFLKSKNVY